MSLSKPVFRLMDLPYTAQKWFAQTLEGEQKVCFSLASKDWKKLVKSAPQDSQKPMIRFIMVDRIEIDLPNHSQIVMSFENRHLNYGNLEIPTPTSIYTSRYLDQRLTMIQLGPSGRNAQDWILYFCEIFGFKTVNVLAQGPGDEFFAKRMKSILGNLEIHELSIIDGRLETYRLTLEEFKDFEKLMMDKNPYNPEELEENVLSKELVHLDLKGQFTFSFSDLLKCQSLNIDITAHAHSITFPQLNEFIRLWRDGSRPKFKSLMIKMSIREWDNNLLDQVMTRIPYSVASNGPKFFCEDVDRSYFYLMEGPNDVKGEFEVWNSEGKKASVLHHAHGKCVDFYFIVCA